MGGIRGWGLIAAFGVCVALGHLGVIAAYPYVAMAAAMAKLSDGGKRVNAWVFPERATEAARAIVRPSPDLAYASCVFDLTRGPVRISVPDWEDYYSLSLYAANTDNFFVINDRAIGPEGLRIVLAREGGAPLTAKEGERIVYAPSARGIALVRMLAPDEERFRRADAVRREAVCEAEGAAPASAR